MYTRYCLIHCRFDFDNNYKFRRFVWSKSPHSASLLFPAYAFIQEQNQFQHLIHLNIPINYRTTTTQQDAPTKISVLFSKTEKPNERKKKQLFVNIPIGSNGKWNRFGGTHWERDASSLRCPNIAHFLVGRPAHLHCLQSLNPSHSGPGVATSATCVT